MKLSTAKSALRKAHTTKETDTKIIKHFENRGRAEQHEAESASAAGTQSTLPIDSNPAVARFMQTYQEQYRAHLDGNTSPILPGDIKRLKSVLDNHSEAEMLKLLQRFFTTDIGYVKRRGYSMGTFLATLNILRVIRQSNPSKTAS